MQAITQKRNFKMKKNKARQFFEKKISAIDKALEIMIRKERKKPSNIPIARMKRKQ